MEPASAGGGAHRRLLGEPRLLRLLHGPLPRPAGGGPVRHVQGRPGQAVRVPLRREDGLRAAVHRRRPAQAGPLPGPRGAGGALHADAGEGLEPGRGGLARHDPRDVRRGARAGVPDPVDVAGGGRARQVPHRTGGTARAARPDRGGHRGAHRGHRGHGTDLDGVSEPLLRAGLAGSGGRSGFPTELVGKSNV
ncbi:hypothetical protein SGPA1_11219 [Streptomyces misionensis JCM 4497]